jgi:phytoene dehydrogenase-like protein
MPANPDYVIIGAGMAGLSAAAYLARAGATVAVFEKHSKLGGYAQYFGNEPTYDASTHLIGGCGPDGWTARIIQETGVLGRLRLLPLSPTFQTNFPRHAFPMHSDPERVKQELETLWPGESNGIRRFLTLMSSLGDAFDKGVAGTNDSLSSHPARDETLSDLLDGCTRDESLRAALSSLWLFAGLPPERLSAVHYGMLWHTYVTQGSASVAGGVKALTQAMSEVITERGGTVENRMRVTRILRKGGRILGVRLEDGRELHPKAVISNATPHDTFDELLADPDQSPAGYEPLRNFVTSVSALQVHLLVKEPLDAPARTTLLHETYDLADAYLDLQRESPRFAAIAATVLDQNDPSRAPEGHHLLSLYTLCPYSRYDNWHVDWDDRRSPNYRTNEDYKALRERLGDGLVAQASTLFPGLQERIVARKVGTPLSMERYTFNAGGAAFGWANLPQQCGAYRPGPETPFRGLYMTGHYTFPGGSIAACLASGRLTAAVALAG